MEMKHSLVKAGLVFPLLFLSGSVLADALPIEQIDLWRDAEIKDLGIATRKAEGWRDKNMPGAKIRMKESCTHWTGCEGKELVKYELTIPGSHQSLECPTQEGRCVVVESEIVRSESSV